MKKYFFNGRPVTNYSEPKENGSFRDGQFWVKVFSDENAFAHELEMLKAVSSCPGVVKMAAENGTGKVDIVSEDGCTATYHAIREDYVGEKDIRKYCKDHCSEAEMTALFAKLAQVLSDVEAAGVIHNDVKPTNVLMTDDGEPVLVDFNISKLKDEPVSDIHIHATSRFSAPEKNRGVVSVKGDIYSFGCVLDACMWQNSGGPDAYSKGLRAVRDKCRIEENPSLRYDSFNEVKEALLNLGPRERAETADTEGAEKRSRINLKDFVMKYLPVLTAILYGSGLVFILLALYMIIRGPATPEAGLPNPKEDISVVISDIRNHHNTTNND